MPLALALLLAPAPPLQDAVAPEAGAPRAKSLLVITLDTARRDFMGFHGRAPSPTPNLDRLAQEAAVFDDAWTVAPLTLPAHASLFTGLYPRSHGVHDNALSKVPQDARTLAEILRERGYATGAAVAAFVLDPMFGLDQGFESYDAPPLGTSGSVITSQRPAAAMVDRALVDLERLAPRAPFFYWLHLFDPHFPYQPPGRTAPTPGFVVDADARSRLMYEEEIRYADEQVGRLLGALRERGLLDQLVLFFASDHGESLRDAPEGSHGFFLRDPTVRIPMLLRAPGIEPRRVGAQASLVDALPTLLDLLGMGEEAAQGPALDGVSLAPLLRDSAREPPERALLLESWYAWLNHGWAPFDGCVQGALKYLRSRRRELFDRAADPGEEINLFDPEEARSRAMARRLDELEQDAKPRLERDAISLSGRDLARLVAMGYSAASARVEDPPDAATLPDVYEKADVIRALEDVLSAHFHKDTAKEEALMRELVERDPQSATLREQFGIFLTNLGPARFDEAEKQLRAALRIEPKSSRSHYTLGRISEKRADALREEIRRRRGEGAGHEELRDLAADERREMRRTLRFYRTCLEFEPHFPDAIERLARNLAEEAERSARAGEVEEAREGLKEADELLERWLSFMPPRHPDRELVESNRVWVEKRRRELAPPANEEERR
jgi:arylsulfatase A-like enzyme